MKHLIPFLCITFLLQLPLMAQVDLLPAHLTFSPESRYNKNIPSPEQFLGYQLGESFTVYAHVVDYFEALAASSSKVSLNQYGKTYEGRPLINLVITSEANQNKIEEIRQEHLKLANPKNLSSEEATNLINTQPVFTSISYNIHGNETSSTEAAMQVAYHLAAAQDADIQSMLNNSVIILFICINPDGRDRYVYWYNGTQRSNTGVEPKDLEHYAPWPNGRTNHYWFDLNRDWVWGIHPESRGHVAEYQKWMPQVHVDYHEMGYNSNYFTMPGTTPRNKLLPDTYEALSDTFGRANVAAFDKNQINYFTRDAFDFFYPGYGSSYPSVMGAIGMLVEQGGIGAGRAIETNDGFILTLRQRIFDHYTTSLATLQKSAEHKELFLRYSYDAWSPDKAKSETKAYILPESASGYLYEVLNIFQSQGVEIHRATANFSVNAALEFRTGENKRTSFPKGTYIISTNQPRHLFLNSIMEKNMTIEDSVMYDMATWSAALAYNLEAFSTKQLPTVALEKIEKTPEFEGKVLNSAAQYAYVIDWKQPNAPKALAKLWEKGYRVRTATLPFSNGQKHYAEGSIIILKGRNREKATKMVADMTQIAESTKVIIDGHDTGRMLDGMDLASSKNRPIEQPKVALMVEPPFNTYSCGQIYFLFDQETALPVERIRTSILKQTALPKFGQRYGLADLNDYDVLILPGGGKSLEKLFDKKYLEELKQWINEGGVVVASESAASFFTADKSKISKTKLLEVKKDSTDSANYLAYADREDFYGKKNIPGSALNALLDTTHPLAFGMEKELYSLKFGSLALKPDPDLQTVGHYISDSNQLLVAGYASEENLKHLAGNTFAAVLPMGQGKIVFLLDNTQYRMFWRGPSRMMQNAVMLLHGF